MSQVQVQGLSIERHRGGLDKDVGLGGSSCAPEGEVGAFDLASGDDGDYGGFPFDVGVLSRAEAARVTTNVHEGRRGSYKRVILVCQYHHDCKKHRNVGDAQQSHFGPTEVLAYLGAWHRAGRPGGLASASKAQHLAYIPPLAEQRRWHAEFIGHV